jgi:DNA-binding response OmpR family regulator
MKLSTLSDSDLKAKHGRLLAAACKVWAEIERRERVETAEKIDFSMFKDTTNRLLTEFMKAPDKMLSQEDIRQDVMFDEAKETAVRDVIRFARKEIQSCHNFYYEIKNIRGKAYQLVKREVWRSVEKMRRTPQKQRKKT